MSWRAHILTLYPEMFPGFLGHSLAGRALERGDWQLHVANIRDYATDRHRSVDDTPSGGGAGMVMRADVVAAAIDGEVAKGAVGPFVYPTPRGKPVTQAWIRQMAASKGVSFLCGRFEGLDQRVVERRGLIEVSLADIVLSGGEPAAMAMIDAMVRLLPGVMGASESGHEESFEQGLLEYPHYTRPALFEGQAIPTVLTSGDHAAVARWRQEQSEAVTRERRPDLWARHRGAEKL